MTISAPCPIIFDLDGTLIDSAPDIHATVNRTLQAYGYGGLSFAQVRSFIGHGAPHLIERVIGTLPNALDADMKASFLNDFLRAYDQAVDLTHLYPNVRGALQHLMDNGHPLAICTNKPVQPTQSILAHLGISDFFKPVIGGDSLATRKPDPAPLRAVLATLSCDPANALYVGDSEVDAQTAQASGVSFALYAHGYRQSSCAEIASRFGCALIFDDFTELTAFIDTKTPPITAP
jgi:phosphoglycolate phosphatase